jgi:hypothetical protein
MPLARELLDEMARKRAAEAVQADRDRRRDLALSGLTCLAWSAAGILCILWSAHTTSLVYGRIAFFGGVGMGNGGILYTLLAAYRRGERRGDW